MGDQCFQFVVNVQIGMWFVFVCFEVKCVVWFCNDEVVGVELKGEMVVWVVVFVFDFDGQEWCIFDCNVQFFVWCDEDMVIIGFVVQDC